MRFIVGRTGRAGRSGSAITYFTNRDSRNLRKYSKLILRFMFISTVLSIGIAHRPDLFFLFVFVSSITGILQRAGCKIPEYLLGLKKLKGYKKFIRN